MGFSPLAAPRRLLSSPPDDQRDVTWGLKDIGKLIGLNVLYMLLVYIPLQPLLSRLGLDGDHLGSTLAGWISIALVCFTHTRYRRWPNASYFGLTVQNFKVTWKQGLCWGIALKVGAPVLGMIGFGILVLLFGGDKSWLSVPTPTLTQMSVGSLQWFCDVVNAVVVAPFSEELICRGMLYAWLASKYNITIGRIVSSLVFAALHGSIAMMLPHFLVGLGLVLLYERTRSLAPCMVAHATGNLVSVALTVVVSAIF